MVGGFLFAFYASFENYELNFSHEGNEVFRQRVRYWGDLGRIGRAGSIYMSQQVAPPDPEPSTEVRLLDSEWEIVLRSLREQENDLDAVQIADKIEEAM